MNDQILSNLVNGTDDSLSDAAKQELEKSLRKVSKQLEDAKLNRSSNVLFGKSGSTENKKAQIYSSTDAELYTNISEMINGSTNSDVGGFSTLLDSLYMKNKKYYTIIKDYEIMPILIPQINRVLMFLVNECISPDIQNDSTFVIRYTGVDGDPHHVQDDIEAIKKKMKLDNLLPTVYMNRYKLGREYYLVEDYNKTFDHMLQMLEHKRLNESADSKLTDMDFLDEQYQALETTINECACDICVQIVDNNMEKAGSTNTRADKENFIMEEIISLNFDHLNIVVAKSPIAKYVKDAHAELLEQAYSNYSMNNMMFTMATLGSLNEAVVDTSKLSDLVSTMKAKKLQRCMIERFDPAKIFKLKIGGKVIGYFYVTDINESAATVNFAQSLKDQLLKSRATNLASTTKTAEEIISKQLAEKIINTFDPNIGINRIEDIDLMHDYVRNNEIYKGNKRVTFYYADEIFDLSRTDESILVNGVFFTKLYATLMLNNIMTKILRGRGRQIHTVRLGVSTSVQRYVQNAMATLTMPENNLGTMHGSFEQILNPFNSASDIIIPTDEDDRKYIDTDYIPGQDVNMDDDFLRMLLNAIVSSFGLDAAVIDATNGNLQFAKTLSMESLQICNMIRNEQQDLHDEWEAMCLEVLRIMGTDDTKTAIANGNVSVEFFEPKSLILQNTIDEINNAKAFAEAIVDIIPEFNEEGTESKRSRAIYQIIKTRTNLDFNEIDKILRDNDIDTIGEQLETKIRELIRQYLENTEERQYGDTNGDNLVTDADAESDDYDNLTAEEQDIMDTET